MFISQFLPSLLTNLLLTIRHIRFISDQHLHDIRLSVCIYLLQPITYIIESHLFRTIIHQQNTHCPLVVGLSNSSEPFLSSSVPNLQLYLFIKQIDCLYPEINTNGGHV